MAGHPAHVVFLTADAFAILPPIARLTEAQARYWFLAGFTARLAGTEIGITEPEPTFSPCFGGPFLPQRPAVYSKLLGEKLAAHGPDVWLVNTGWTGGPEARAAIACRSRRRARCCTRRSRAGSTTSSTAPTRCSASRCRSPCRASSRALLDPRSTWHDPAAYDAKAAELAQMFHANFAKFEDVEPEVAAGGPIV